ncbi:MAG: chemotaxis protein CheW [Myxococcota bacterium]
MEQSAREHESHEGSGSEDRTTTQFLTFSLGEVTYGIDIGHVIEIVGMQSITSVPNVPEYVKGVINLRGQVIPLIDVRLRFRMPPLEYHNRTCVIVVRIDKLEVGFIVDVVQEVVTVSRTSLEPPPEMGYGQFTEFISGIVKIDEDVKMILDVVKLLYDQDAAPARRSA